MLGYCQLEPIGIIKKKLSIYENAFEYTICEMVSIPFYHGGEELSSIKPTGILYNGLSQ